MEARRPLRSSAVSGSGSCGFSASCAGGLQTTMARSCRKRTFSCELFTTAPRVLHLLVLMSSATFCARNIIWHAVEAIDHYTFGDPIWDEFNERDGYPTPSPSAPPLQQRLGLDDVA